MSDVDGIQTTEANRMPRTASRLITAAFGLYRRFPLLFFLLAAGVIVPYQLIVLAATGAGPLAQAYLSFGVSSLLMLIEWVLIGPLVSALHVHAVGEVREGRNPRIVPVAERGLRVLPVVAAASVISGLGIALGLVALIVPGIILMFRWVVVAQAAAIEPEGWLPALRRSRQLTAGHYGHILVFIIYVGLIVTVPTLLIGLGFGHHSTTAASFMVGLIVRIFTNSFGALTSALLYYDLRVRWEGSTEEEASGDLCSRPDPQQGANQHLDPRKYPT